MAKKARRRATPTTDAKKPDVKLTAQDIKTLDTLKLLGERVVAVDGEEELVDQVLAHRATSSRSGRGYQVK